MKTISKLILVAIVHLYASKSMAQWSSNPSINNAICEATGAQTFTKVVPDGAGGAIIIWRDSRNVVGNNNNYDIYAQRIDSLGFAKWTTNGIAICTEGSSQENATIVSDVYWGGFVITWEDSRNGNLNKDIYAQRIDTTGAIHWATNGILVCSASSDQTTPAIVAGYNGDVTIAWTDYRNGANNSDIYAQSLDLNGINKWATNGIPICTLSTSNQSTPIMVSDGSNGAVLGWYDYRNGNIDLYSQAVDASGNLKWTASGVAICTSSSPQFFPKIVGNSNGGALFAWNSNNGSSYDIYVQEVESNGNVIGLNNGNGFAIVNANNDQYLSDLLQTGYGDYIMTWSDYRNGITNPDIYAQRFWMNSSGNTIDQWTSNGIAVSTKPNAEEGAKLTYDFVTNGTGLKGFFVTWAVSGEGIHAQKINNSGVLQWPSSLLISSPPSSSNPLIVYDEIGGAIVILNDSRSGHSNVYAQNICSAGALGGIPIITTGITGPNVICANTINTFHTSSTSGNNYIWTLPNGWSGSSTVDSINATANGNGGQITVTATNACGTSNIATYTVNVNQYPTVSLGNDTSFCLGNSILNAGNSGATYLWNDLSNSQTYTVNSSGTYSVIVTLPGGCSASDTINIVIHPKPTVNLGNDSATCQGGSIYLDAYNGTNGLTYLWNDSTTSQSITATNTGQYYVTVTNSFGCKANDSVNLTFHPLPVVSLGNDTVVCGGSLVLDAGNPGCSYIWNANSATTQTISVSQNGPNPTTTYFVNVTSIYGCTGTDDINVTFYPKPTATYNETKTKVCVYNPTFTLTPGTPANGTYSGTGVSGNSFNPSIAGTDTFNIIYTYTDSNSCSASDTSQIIVDLCIGVDSYNSNNPTFTVTPNPSNGEYLIGSSIIVDEIIITNVLGETILNTKPTSLNTFIDFTSQDAGIYFIKSRVGNFETVNRVIINK